MNKMALVSRIGVGMIARRGLASFRNSWSGITAATVTKFKEDGRVDAQATQEHAEKLLSKKKVDRVLMYGTTGEGLSLTTNERLQCIEDLSHTPMNVRRVMIGTGACTVEEAALLTRKTVDMGASALVCPPPHCKKATEEGIIRFFRELIQRVNRSTSGFLYLYSNPAVSATLSANVVETLANEFPSVVAGVKDTDFSGAYPLGTELQRRGITEQLCVMPGSEARMAESIARGAGGIISATANVTGKAAKAAWEELCAAPPLSLEEAKAMEDTLLCKARHALAEFNMLGSIKALVARSSGDVGWRRVRAPMLELHENQWRTLAETVMKFRQVVE